MENTCENITESDNDSCSVMFDCCDCGCTDGDGCGCAYCWSCNACEICNSDID